MGKTSGKWFRARDIEERTADDSNIIAMKPEKRDLEQLHARIRELQNRILADQIEMERLQGRIDERLQEIGMRGLTDVRETND